MNYYNLYEEFTELDDEVLSHMTEDEYDEYLVERGRCAFYKEWFEYIEGWGD